MWSSLRDIDVALTITAQVYLKGVWHSVKVWAAIAPFFSNKHHRMKESMVATLKCIVVNVIMIAGSDLLFSRFLAPVIESLGDHIIGESSRDVTDRSLVMWLCAVLYYGLWLLPLWILIYAAVNLPTYQVIVLMMRHDTPKAPTNKLDEAAEEAYRYVFFSALLLQKYAIQLLPTRLITFGIGVPFSMIVCALYCFDYAWAAHGIRVTRRHSLIEEGWPYFIGFGTPLTIVTFFLPFYQYLATYAALFPFTLVLALSHADEAINSSLICSKYVAKVPIFRVPCWITERVVRLMSDQPRHFGRSSSASG